VKRIVLEAAIQALGRGTHRLGQSLDIDREAPTAPAVAFAAHIEAVLPMRG
jgi:hypothetical protein